MPTLLQEMGVQTAGRRERERRRLLAALRRELTSLRLDRLTELSTGAARIAADFPNWVATFASTVRREQGW